MMSDGDDDNDDDGHDDDDGDSAYGDDGDQIQKYKLLLV